MEGSLEDLAQYRIKRAWEMLEAAKENLKIGQYKTALNRSYYAVFHAMRAANILRGFDSSKHSGVIAFFTKEFLKTEYMDRKLSFIIKSSSLLREKSDYDDFFIASRTEAEKQVENAGLFVAEVERFINIYNISGGQLSGKVV